VDQKREESRFQEKKGLPKVSRKVARFLEKNSLGLGEGTGGGLPGCDWGRKCLPCVKRPVRA